MANVFENRRFVFNRCKVSEYMSALNLEEYAEFLEFSRYEYKIGEFYKAVRQELLVDADKDEVFYVNLVFREDVARKFCDRCYSSAFRKRSNIREFIAMVEYEVDGCIDEDDGYFWSIEKYRIVDGEYQLIFNLWQEEGVIFGIQFYPDVMMKNFTKNERIMFEEYQKLSSDYLGGYKVKYPFVKGDIVSIDLNPLENRVKYGVIVKDDMLICYDKYRNISVERLCNWGYSNAAALISFPSSRAKKASDCKDEFFIELAKVLKSNSKEENERLIRDVLHVEDGMLSEDNSWIHKLQKKVKEAAEDD